MVLGDEEETIFKGVNAHHLAKNGFLTFEGIWISQQISMHIVFGFTFLELSPFASQQDDGIVWMLRKTLIKDDAWTVT